MLDKLVKDGNLSDSQAMDAISRLLDDGGIRFSKSRKFEVAAPQGLMQSSAMSTDLPG